MNAKMQKALQSLARVLLRASFSQIIKNRISHIKDLPSIARSMIKNPEDKGDDDDAPLSPPLPAGGTSYLANSGLV
jgi:hypothetical protein